MHYLRVSYLELLVGVRKDRKDAGLKEILACVFQQPGIALPAHNLIVDAARFFARSDFADEPSIAVPNGKFCDRSGLGNWEKVRPFECGGRIVAKYLFDVCRGDLRADLRVDLDRFDGKRSGERNGSRIRATPARTGDDDSLCAGDGGQA